MKKKLILLSFLVLTALSYSIISCQHQIRCEDVNFQISTTHTNTSLNQSDGTITATATGGSGFEFSLDNGAFQSNGNFTNLAAGTYIVHGRNAVGCSGEDTVVISSAADPCAGVSITLTETHLTPTSGQSNGSITVTPSPAGSYTYSIDGAPFQSSNIFTGLAAGTYVIVAKNSTGCIGTALSVTLGSIDPCSGVTITVTATTVNPTTGQSNGSITATASPAGTYTYSINGVNFQSSNVFSGLTAGNYNVTSKNTNGCIGSTQVSLAGTNPCTGVTINVTNTPSNPTNGANGSITASASGGVSPYTYSLSGGAFISTSTFSALSSGAYTVIAKDANGCSSTATAVSLACPPVLASGTPTSSRANCANNSIACVGANGVAPYTYSINGTTFQTSATITPLAGGVYTITVKDAKGCSATNSVTINAPATVHFATDVKPTINTYCGRANIGCHNHNNSWTTYADIVGTSSGSTWTSNLMTFIGRARGTSTSTLCVYATGQHNMPPTNSSAWTTFIQGVFTDWVNQGYPNN
jgi:hypothetical protein